jgi:glycosyltransferase involved in cell wall biosynthesis
MSKSCIVTGTSQDVAGRGTQGSDQTVTVKGGGRRRIGFILAPNGQAGGGMGRVKDYILQSGGDRHGRIRFVALDTRGSGSVGWSILLTAKAVLRIWVNALFGRVALVHVNLGDRGSAVRKGLAVLLVRLAAVPVVLHLHAAELVDDYANSGRAVRFLVRMPFRAATCCVVLGRVWRDWLVDTLGIDPSKVVIVYNVVPVVAAPRAATDDSSDRTRRILFLGNLMHRKGIFDLLHAVAQLPTGSPPWQLIVAGGGEIEECATIAQKLEIADRVAFAGWVDQARARVLLAEADMLVLPSYDEGLPLVILEALGMGTPVLCTPVGAIPEVLEDLRTAVFVRPGDPGALSLKLQRLLEDASLRQTLSTNGMALFARQFTLDAFIERLFDVYRLYCGVELEMISPVQRRVPQHAIVEPPT